jgi:hypothetical protein
MPDISLMIGLIVLFIGIESKTKTGPGAAELL